MADDLFTSRLLSGERILWSGKPGQGLLLTAQDIYAIPFSLLWCGIVIVGMIGASRTAGVDSLVLALFLCFGLYMLGGRFVVDAWIRRDLRYAVTNKRILIARPAPFSRFHRAQSRAASRSRFERAGKWAGHNSFRTAAPAWGYQSMSPAFGPPPQFLAIDEARRVFDLIQRTARKDKQ